MPPLQKKFPRLRLSIREGMTALLVEELVHHRLDAALVALPVAAPGLQTAALFDEPFQVLVPKDHVLGRRKSVREEDLRGERVLLLTEGHCLRDQALAICGNDDSAGDDFRATSLETIRHLVAAGFGCTLSPALATASLAAAATVVVRPFKTPAPHRRIGLVWRRSFPDAAGLRALTAFIRAHVPRAARAVADTEHAA